MNGMLPAQSLSRWRQCLHQLQRYGAGNAVEGPDGRVHVLLRMPVHLPESKVDLNHACLLTWAPGPTRQARYHTHP